MQAARTREPDGGLAAASSLGDRLRGRRATPRDEGFLRTLFAEARPELALLPETVRDQLIDLQFTSQLRQYRTTAPDAVDWILELALDGEVEPVGRCYLWQGDQEHRLLDLAIAARWRRRGLAGAVLDRLRAGAQSAGVPLRLSVWSQNADARRLYDRHGFVADDGSGADAGAAPQATGYLHLRWTAEGRT